MAEQRMVPVELLEDCIREAGYVENYGLIRRLRAIISGPGVEPVATLVAPPLDSMKDNFWMTEEDAIRLSKLPYGTRLYLAAPSAPGQEWPVLDRPAKVGNGRFHVGVSSRLVVEAAQRHYEYEVTPDKEAARIAHAAEYIEALTAPVARCHECGKLIDGPGVEPVAEVVIPNDTELPWCFGRNQKAEITPGFHKLYLAAAPQPPATAQPSAVACPTDKEQTR